MNIIRFQGENQNIYYEFDKDSTPLGEGGMGRVYQGYRIDTLHNFQAVVAIKCIKPELVSNATVIQRAQRESSVQLDHSNLIRMYGFFSGAEFNQFSGAMVPSYYIAMERLIGVNLDEILFKGIVTDKTGMVVPVAEELRQYYVNNKVDASIYLMQSILSGVGFLHQNGFIHRDLDPSNIMLTQSGNTKIIDYGICRRIGMSSMGDPHLTQAGHFLGKVAYAAPELILGDLRSQGPCTDIYALGIMLYQLLTGSLPVQGSDQEVMDAHLKGTMDYSLVEDRHLRNVIKKATAKDPSKRYASAIEFSAALSCKETAQKTSYSHHTGGGVVSSGVRNNNYPLYLTLAAVAGLATGIVISLL